jgi:hypothetical protein
MKTFWNLLYVAVIFVSLHWGQLCALGAVWVLFCKAVLAKFPALPTHFPRVHAFVEVCAALWPDLEQAVKASARIVTGAAVALPDRAAMVPPLPPSDPNATPAERPSAKAQRGVS